MAKRSKKKWRKMIKAAQKLNSNTPALPSLPAMVPSVMLPSNGKGWSELASSSLPGISMGELGTSGIKENNGFVAEAYNRALYWPDVYPEYSRLRRSMPEMAMIRIMFTSMGRSVSPTVELPEKPTDDDKRYAEFISSEFDNIEGGWGQLMETMVSQVPFMGWGRWEVVPGLRDPEWKPPQAGDEWRSTADDELVGIRRIAWRDQGTLEKWKFDEHKRMIGMWQRDWPNPSVYLPNSKCLHLTFGDPNNPEGLAGLEPVWRLERIRYGLEVILGIGFEHAAGYLDVTKTEGGTLTSEDKMNIEKAAMNILTAKEGNFAAWPPGIVGTIKDVGFQAAGPLLSAIQNYNILALSVFLSQFIAFNTLSGAGSYASSSDSSQMAIMAYNGMMDGFANQIDQQLGKFWWEHNKEEFPNVTKRPKIKFSHVQKGVELGVLGQFIGQIKDTIPLGESDMAAIRRQTEFLPQSLPEDDEVVNKQSIEEPSSNPSPFGTNGNGAKPPTGDEEIGNAAAQMKAALAMYSRDTSDESTIHLTS